MLVKPETDSLENPVDRIFSEMGAVCSAIGSWLKAGISLATRRFKRIWEAVKDLFTKACDALKWLLNKISFGASYSSETSYVQTEPNRVEVCHLLVFHAVFVGNTYIIYDTHIFSLVVGWFL